MKGVRVFTAMTALACLVSAVAVGAEVEIGLDEGDVEVPVTTAAKDKENRKSAAVSEKGCESVHSCWCDWFQRKWGDVPNDSLDPLPQAKLDAISDEYIAKCKSAVERDPKSGSAQANLGEALIFRKQWKPAREAFAAALNLKPRSYEETWYRYRIAETWFGEGKTKSAIAELDRAKAIWAPSGSRYKPNWCRLAADASVFLSGNDLDFYRMPRDTGFKPFPEPQQATYSEDFAPCSRIALKLTGVKKDDARISLLTKKLSARGFKWGYAGLGYPLAVALDPSAPVDKPEGYTLEVTKKGASIRARDAQGVLWGIVSFLQVADPEKHTARICKVDDWPDCPRRGYLGHLWAGCTEFTVFNKMNIVVHQQHPMRNGWDSPLNVYQCETLAREFHGLGLEIQYGIYSWTMDMGWPYCWKKYLGMQIEIGRRFAAMGAGVYYPNDDLRYGPNVLRKEDLATGLKPSDFDAQHILDFFNGVREKYPEFRMTYCPPFYWGPGGRHRYPDDRDKYLRSLRVFPPEITLFWTGDRVKSFKKEPWMVKWFTNLTGRKPYLFQNATGPHNLYSYVVDRTDWNGWHYPGFFEKDIAGYLKNSNTPMECPQLTSLADCLWNVKAYDPETGIRRGMGNYAGDAFFNALDSAIGDLSYIDKFWYGQLDATVRDEDVAELERKLGRIEKATATAESLNGPDFLNSCGKWMVAVGWFRKLVKAAKNPPDYRTVHKALLERTLGVAEAAGYDRDRGDILLDAVDLHHSDLLGYPWSGRGKPAPADQLLASTIWPSQFADAKFRVGSLAKKGEAEIVLRGASETGYGKDKSMALELNGLRVVDCKTPFDREFSSKSFKVPLSAFRPNAENHMKILNVKDNRRLVIAFVLIKFPTSGVKPPSIPSEETPGISLDE